jgi:hypothetical protein
VLPAGLWTALSRSLASDVPWEAEAEILPLAVVSAVVGPSGLVNVDDAVASCDCPAVPELLRPARL